MLQVLPSSFSIPSFETRGVPVPAPGFLDRVVVVALPGNASPPYPARLAAVGIEGDVVARFVVDTTGRVEPGSVQISVSVSA